VKLILTEVSRITSSLPIAAIEDIEGQGRLSLAVPETIRDQSSFVFSQGVIGGGYASTLTLVNAGTGTLDVTVSFGLGTRSLQIPPNSLRLVSLADVSPTLAGEIRADAVRVTAAPLLIGTSRLLGALDVENSLNRVSLGSRPEATEFVFPHVAHGAGYFTGICLITGNAASTITVDVYTADGKMRRSATVVVGPNQQIARVISELVPSVVSQSGGYIRIYSSDPILAWEVYGSDEAFASGPPL
jgi:hypothetical protein